MGLRSFLRRQSGFSLVEVAIALAIIGLIVAGILKGQDLLENARLKSVISQVDEYRLATHTFYDRFGALPGDFDQASIYINSQLRNGNRNGILEGAGLSASGHNHECVSFWEHLAAAQLISAPGKTRDGQAHFGQGAPICRLGGGFTVKSNPEAEMNGVWFILGQENGAEGNGALLTPHQALSLMLRFDSPDPLNGKIQARNGAGVETGSCIKNKVLNLQNKKPACVLYFQL